MIVAFCGHTRYMRNAEDEKAILDILNDRVGEAPCDFFVGEYGNFDAFAYDCVKKFKKDHAQANLIFITPYFLSESEKNSFSHQKQFDFIIYPELENVPRRYAIIHRNRWIVEQADILIAYVTHTYGGAYTMYQYAKRKTKEIYNIANKGNVE